MLIKDLKIRVFVLNQIKAINNNSGEIYIIFWDLYYLYSQP